MSPAELNGWLTEELAAFPGKVSLLMVDLTSGRDLHAIHADVAVSSASTIKLPILLTAFEQIEQGRLALRQPVPVPEESILPDTRVFEPENRRDTYPLQELLYWMITDSDNTATNALITLLGMDAVNDLCRRWGAASTVLQREMLDFDALAAGRNNLTSARDQYRLYAELHRRVLLGSPGIWPLALDPLLRQRCRDTFLRYLNGPITLAHKTGGLDHVNHDAGLFLDGEKPYYLGIFTWDGPALDGESFQKRFIGKLARTIYQTYHGAPSV